MTDDDATPMRVGILLKSQVSGLIDVSDRAEADVPFEAGDDLPFEDRCVAAILLGDAVASLSVRDQIQLLMQCRRVLIAGATIVCVENAATTYATLTRWAELVGLVDSPKPQTGVGWQKREARTESSPLVSILIPSANPAYFAASLDSAIAQSYKHIEIIICDDCENDGIEKIAASRAGLASIQYIRNPERLRARKNYEKCLSLAHGEYVKFLNDDDVLAPQCIEKFVAAFAQIPDLVLATSHRWRINAKSEVIDDMPATRPVVDRDLIVDGLSLANAVIMYGLNIIGEPSTAMFRRIDLDARPHIDGETPFHFNGEEIRGAVDLAMWSRLLVQGNVAFFHERLSSFRIHGEQAQARPEVVARSVTGIRSLQQQWINLGLFRRYPPNLVVCQPYPRSEAEANDWSVEPVRSFPTAPLPPEEAIQAWRATRRHAFETS